MRPVLYSNRQWWYTLREPLETLEEELDSRSRVGRKSSFFRKLLYVVVALALITLFRYSGSPGKTYDPLVKVVEIPVGSGMEIRPVLARGGEHFSKIIDRLQPYAAINGTFYDERLHPLGDVFINGKLVNRGAYRHAIAITGKGSVSFIERRNGRFNWSGYRSGLAAGPRLVHDGKIVLDPVADGFTLRSRSVRAWRSGVGITKAGKLLLVTAKKSLTLDQFAETMLDLGSVEAMNLDGGAACGLYYHGRTLANPTIPMTSVLVVYKKKSGR